MGSFCRFCLFFCSFEEELLGAAHLNHLLIWYFFCNILASNENSRFGFLFWLGFLFVFLLAFVVGFLACVCKIIIYLRVFYELVIFPFFWGTFDGMNFRTCCFNLPQYVRVSALRYIILKC